MHHHHLLQQRWALGFSLAALFQIPLDFACYPDPCAYHAIPWIAAAIVIWGSFAGRSLVARSFPALPHEWPAIVATTAFVFAAHADAGVSASISGASIRSITGLHLMRVVSVVQVLPFVSQWLRHTWHLNVTSFFCAIAIVPVAFLQPILLGIPGTWEARNAQLFEATFVVEALVLAAASLLSRIASFYSVQWQKSSEQALVDLDTQATLAQNLLETAVPPFIARSLLAGTPPDALARSFDSATIAFILLEDYRDKMSSDPRDAMTWLDHVFVAFDSLVDRYDERVNKIEVVANTYLLSTGLPLEDPDHVEVMCAFCADIQALCRDIPGVGPVKVRIGVASGPVTSGVIGQSRRFFRVFGDTVNMASRMMSTSVEGHIHLSESAANKMMSWQRTSDASSWPFAVVHRGKIAVKGKGDVDTYWLQASMVESAQAIKRSDRNLRLQADPMHMPVVAAPPANLSESCTVDPTVAPQWPSTYTSLTIRVPQTVHSIDDFNASTVDMVYKVFTPGAGTPSSALGTPEVAGSPPMVGTPGTAMSRRMEFRSAPPSTHRSEYKRTSSDIFLRRTVGDVFAAEIRGNPIYSRNETDVVSPSLQLAASSKPVFHSIRTRKSTVAHAGELAVPAPTTDMHTPIETISVTRERGTVYAPNLGGSIGAIQSNALDVILESTATSGGADQIIPGVLSSELSAPYSSSEQSVEVPFRSARSLTCISAAGVNAGFSKNDAASLSMDMPLTRSGVETSLPSEQIPSHIRDDLIHDEMVSISPPPADRTSVSDVITPEASNIDHTDSRSQRSCQERRLSTKSIHKLYAVHHTAASVDSHSLTTSPSFKPLSIHDRVAGNAGSDGRPRHKSQATLRFVEPSSRSAASHKTFPVNAQLPVQMGATQSGAAQRPLSHSVHSSRPLANTQRHIGGGMQLFESSGTPPKSHVHLADPLCTNVADIDVSHAPSGDLVAVSVTNMNLRQALPPQTAMKAAVIEPIQKSDHFVIRWNMGLQLLIRLRADCWNALSIPRFVDQAHEDNAAVVVQQKMVEASIFFFLVNAITVTAIAIALTLLEEFRDPGQFFSLAVVVAVLSVIAWRLHRIKRMLIRKPTNIALLLTIFFSTTYISLVAILIWHRECEVACVISEQISPVNELTWGAFILSVADLCTLAARIDAKHTRYRVVAFLCADVLWLSLQSYVKHFVDPGVAVIVCFALFIVHAISLFISIHMERLERSGIALKCALEAAVTDRKKLLDDLFPPVIVEALVSGSEVPPLVSTGTVVLHIDFIGFTRMCSELTPQQIMRTMNTVYSVFDVLVEEASSVDGALWKVDTVGDAYMVVGGIARIGSQREFRSPSNRGVATPRQPGAATTSTRVYDARRITSRERRTRELLERIFSLARAMQDALIDLRDELGVPLRARMGVHCGDVVSGILGSQRPRFCVLGPAMLEAEQIEASGIADEIACSAAVQTIYLSTAYEFESIVPAGHRPDPILLLRCPQPPCQQ